MLVKALFIAAIFSIAYSNDTFLESVRSESGLSLGSLLGGDVKLVAYDGKRCTGNEIGTISCDGQSCLDYKKAKSMMIIGKVDRQHMVNISGFGEQGCEKDLRASQNYFESGCCLIRPIIQSMNCKPFE